MSITGIGYNTKLDVLAVEANTEKTKHEKLKQTDEWLDSVSMSSMSEKLARLVKGGGTDIVQSMTEDLQDLQGNFIEALTDKLAGTDVDISKSFILKKDEDGNIVVDGDHPDKAAIEAAINTDSTLKAAYDKIAEQAELIGTVTSNPTYKANTKALAAYQSQLQAMSASFLLNVQDGSMQGSTAYGLASYL